MGKEKVLGILGLIALRKSELYFKIVSILSKEKQLSEKDKDKIKGCIAAMENERLLSNKEKEKKEIIPNLKLENIGFDIESFIKEINVILNNENSKLKKK